MIFRYFVSPFVAIFIFIVSLFNPQVGNGGISPFANEILYTFDYKTQDRDTIYNGVSWVNSAVKQDGYGFENFDILLEWKVDAINSNELYFKEGRILFVELSYNSKFYIDYDFIKLDISYEYDSDYSVDNWISVADNNIYSLSDFTDDLVFTFYKPNNNTVVVEGNDIFNYSDNWLKDISYSLIDRDMNTYIEFAPSFKVVNDIGDDSDFGWVDITYKYEISFPSYSTFRSVLVSKGISNVNLKLITDDDSMFAGIDRDIYTDFYYSFNDDYPIAKGYISELRSVGKDNDWTNDGMSYDIPFDDKDLVRISVAPEEVNLQGDFDFVYATRYRPHASGSSPFQLVFTLRDEVREINFFSDDPVVGGFYGKGEVQYENVAWYDVFGHLRNFTRWLLFDSFIYDMFSPIFDPLFNFINSISVFIYNCLNVIGWIDPHNQDQYAFLVEMLYNIFMVYVVFKFINLIS